MAKAFPAYAGMNRPAAGKGAPGSSVPRVCGDEPAAGAPEVVWA